jgi:superfamily II DNA or RNA helicase
MKLRPYQEDIVKKVHKEIEDNGKEKLIYSPTGSGKSIIIAKLVQDFVNQDLTVCILVNISKLIPQLIELFTNLNIEHNVYKAGMDKHIGSKVSVAMQQTLYARSHIDLKCDVLIIDERHISFDTKSMNDVIDRLQPKQIIGFSATPIDADGFFIDGVDIIQGLTIKELTEQGYLTRIRTFVAGFSEKLDFSEVNVKAGDYNEVQLSKIINTDEYNQSVFESWNTLAKERKTIVFCTGIEHAEAMNQVYMSNGIKSGLVHSKIGSKINDDTFKQFSDDELQVLCSIGMISTGWDEPSVSCVVNCNPTMSKRKYLQQVGRGCRLHHTKTDTLLLDFAKNTTTHGLYDEPIQEHSDRTNKNIARSHDNISGIDLLVPDKESVVELNTRLQIKMMIEEVKDRKRKGNLKDLIELFESSQDMSELCELIVLIDTLYSGRENGLQLPRWISDKWERKLNQYPEHRSRFTKAFKTRAKAIVQSGKTTQPKKIASLFYFIDFLIDNANNESDRWF